MIMIISISMISIIISSILNMYLMYMSINY